MSDVNRAVVRRSRRLYTGRQRMLMVFNDTAYLVDNPINAPVSLGATPACSGTAIQYDQTSGAVMKLSGAGEWWARSVYGPYVSSPLPTTPFSYSWGFANGANGITALNDQALTTGVVPAFGAAVTTISVASPGAPLDRQSTPSFPWGTNGVLSLWYEFVGVFAPSWGLYHCSMSGVWTQILSCDPFAESCGFYFDAADQLYFARGGLVYRLDGGLIPVPTLVGLGTGRDVLIGNGLIVSCIFAAGSFVTSWVSGPQISSVSFSAQFRGTAFNGREFVAYDSANNDLYSSVDGRTWQVRRMPGANDINGAAFVVIPE